MKVVALVLGNLPRELVWKHKQTGKIHLRQNLKWWFTGAFLPALRGETLWKVQYKAIILAPFGQCLIKHEKEDC